MAATEEGGPFDSEFCARSHFNCRPMSRNALPLSARHLYPGIGPPFMGVHRFSRRIGARGFKGARGYGRIAKYRYIHIFEIGTDIFGGFRGCQRLGLVADFPLYRGIYEFVGQQRSDQVRIICLL
jgi:hypothetical protein